MYINRVIKTIAPYNASDVVKREADIVCEGQNDDEAILEAIDLASVEKGNGAYRWGSIKLLAGRYNYNFLDIPPLMDFTIDAIGATLGQKQDTSPAGGIRFDSMTRCHIYLGQITGCTNNIACEIAPRNPTLVGNIVGVTESPIYINEITGYPSGAGKTGLKITVTGDGDFGYVWSPVTTRSINKLDKSIVIAKPTGTKKVIHNKFDIGTMTGGINALIVGDVDSSGNKKIYHNIWDIATLDATNYGVQIFSDEDVFKIYQAATDLNKVVLFGSYAQNNVVIGTKQVFDKGYTDLSAPPNQSTNVFKYIGS